jgi:hypothetical protein
MPKALLNEAERYLLENWGNARLLEESMDKVRSKYKEVIDRVIEEVTDAHRELDASKAYPTQFWGEGYIGFGKKSWPSRDSDWPSGLWVWGIRLEILVSDDWDPPSAYLSFSPKVKAKFDFESARRMLLAAAKDILKPEELAITTTEVEGSQLIYLPAPSKSDLLNGLLDGNGEAYVSTMVSQFDSMARFVPVLDKVFRDCVPTE